MAEMAKNQSGTQKQLNFAKTSVCLCQTNAVWVLIDFYQYTFSIQKLRSSSEKNSSSCIVTQWLISKFPYEE